MDRECNGFEVYEELLQYLNEKININYYLFRQKIVQQHFLIKIQRKDIPENK